MGERLRARVRDGRAPAVHRVVHGTAAGGRGGAAAPAGLRHRVPARVSAGLYRPLAQDGERARFRVRHVQTGVLLGEIAGLACLLCTWTTTRRGTGTPCSSCWPRPSSS